MRKKTKLEGEHIRFPDAAVASTAGIAEKTRETRPLQKEQGRRRKRGRGRVERGRKEER